MKDTRDRLIESAQELLWDRGYTGTSPRAILERAEVGQGSMYHHFAGKADLAQAAVRRTAEQMVPTQRALLDGPGAPMGRLRAYLRTQREVLRGCRLGRLVQDHEVIGDPALREPIAEVFAGAVERVAAVLREGQESGDVRGDVDPRQAATTVIAAIQGGYVLARAAQDEQRFTDAIDGVLALLAAPPAGPWP